MRITAWKQRKTTATGALKTVHSSLGEVLWKATAMAAWVKGRPQTCNTKAKACKAL